MAQRQRLLDWFAANRDVLWDLLRIYVGFALVIKGFVYIFHWRTLVTMMDAHGVPLGGAGLAQVVALCHIAGGLMMTFGMLTRIGAAIQIPNLLGAILFVHLGSGLFTDQQTLEFELLVLALLVMYALGGAGRLSIDHYFTAPARPLAREAHT